MNIAILRTPERIANLPIYPGVPTSATVAVKYLPPEEQLAVAILAKELEATGTSREDAWRMAYGRVAVKGWDGINDGADPLPFTVENTDFLMLQCTEFRTLVLESAVSLRRSSEKNSLTTVAPLNPSPRSPAPLAKKRKKKE